MPRTSLIVYVADARLRQPNNCCTPVPASAATSVTVWPGKMFSLIKRKLTHMPYVWFVPANVGVIDVFTALFDMIFKMVAVDGSVTATVAVDPDPEKMMPVVSADANSSPVNTNGPDPTSCRGVCGTTKPFFEFSRLLPRTVSLTRNPVFVVLYDGVLMSFIYVRMRVNASMYAHLPCRMLLNHKNSS